MTSTAAVGRSWSRNRAPGPDRTFGAGSTGPTRARSSTAAAAASRRPDRPARRRVCRSRSRESRKRYRVRASVPNRLQSMGNRQPTTLVRSSAGPPARKTRRWISAASRLGVDRRVDSEQLPGRFQIVDALAKAAVHGHSISILWAGDSCRRRTEVGGTCSRVLIGLNAVDV